MNSNTTESLRKTSSGLGFMLFAASLCMYAISLIAGFLFYKKLKNKTVNRWYYYFYEPLTGKKIQKACRGCRNQAEAYAYISSLPPLFEETKVTIATIAKYMFVPESEHVRRLEKLGKELDFKPCGKKDTSWIYL